jgi:lipopolysaccharide/colanic/teichoic acid biosynthesis glycosyltransferase
MSDPAVEYWAQAKDPARLRARLLRCTLKRRRWSAYIHFLGAMKRTLDIAGSLVGIAILGPTIFLAGLLIKMEDGGPIFFRQERVGKDGKTFGLYKLRSMVLHADSKKSEIAKKNQHGKDSITFKMKKDPRVTRIGRWLRRFSLDEVPQFFNILIGDMSLVGPRPPVPQEVARYKAAYLRRLRVKPGLTGIWQVSGRADVDFEGQVRYDLEYIRSESIWKDITLLLRTIPAVLTGRGAY